MNKSKGKPGSDASSAVQRSRMVCVDWRGVRTGCATVCSAGAAGRRDRGIKQRPRRYQARCRPALTPSWPRRPMANPGRRARPAPRRAPRSRRSAWARWHRRPTSVCRKVNRACSTLQQLKLPSPAWLRTIGDPDMVRVEPLTSLAPRNMFFLFGQKVGSTNLMFQDKSGRCAMVEVAVGIDTASVQASLAQLLPNEKNIRIATAANSLVLSGVVADAMAVDQVLAIANAYVRRAGGAGPGGGAARAGRCAGGERIVNMLSVAAPQQVMLEVKVAEVSKTLLDKLGANTTVRAFGGSWAYTLLSNFLTGTLGGSLSAIKSNGSQLAFEAENRDGLVRILAEPNVMAISGQEGSFLAGGKIFIPVAQAGSRRHHDDHAGRKGIRRRPALHADRAGWRAHQYPGRAGSLGTVARRRRHHRHRHWRHRILPLDHDPARHHHGAAVRRPELRDRRPDQEQHHGQHEGLAGAG